MERKKFSPDWPPAQARQPGGNQKNRGDPLGKKKKPVPGSFDYFKLFQEGESPKAIAEGGLQSRRNA